VASLDFGPWAEDPRVTGVLNQIFVPHLKDSLVQLGHGGAVGVLTHAADSCTSNPAANLLIRFPALANEDLDRLRDLLEDRGLMCWIDYQQRALWVSTDPLYMAHRLHGGGAADVPEM
jgi:hypothetical protein